MQLKVIHCDIFKNSTLVICQILPQNTKKAEKNTFLMVLDNHRVLTQKLNQILNTMKNNAQTQCGLVLGTVWQCQKNQKSAGHIS